MLTRSVVPPSAILSIAYVLVLLAACGRGRPAGPPPEPFVPMQPLSDAARVFYDNGLGFADSARIVVRDSMTWRTVWIQATRSQPSPPPMPAVDFGQDVIVVAAAGRLKPGDAIRVDSIGVRGSLTVLAVRTVVACQPFPSDAFPFEIVRIPRRDGPVRFNEHRVRSPGCS